MLIAFVFIGFTDEPTTYSVTGKVTGGNNHCGGDELGEEDLKELARPFTISGTEFYIRKGKTNDVSKPIYKTITTDKEGKFKIDLPAGDYVIVEAEKKDKTKYNEYLKNFKKKTETYDPIDKACLKKWLATPLAGFTVINSETPEIKIHIVKPCAWNAIPCANYTGSPPP